MRDRHEQSRFKGTKRDGRSSAFMYVSEITERSTRLSYIPNPILEKSYITDPLFAQTAILFSGEILTMLIPSWFLVEKVSTTSPFRIEFKYRSPKILAEAKS
jgi:hypothetical protein